MNRLYFVFSLAILLSSCTSISFDKAYYEKSTGIRFPDKYRVLETFDNGEFLTGTVLQLHSLSMSKMISDYHFDTARHMEDIHLFSTGWLKRYKPEFSSLQQLFILRRSENKLNWNYIADLNTGRLWAEISYPDWGGQ